MRKLILSEKGLVIVLFVLVLIVFSFAQEDTKKIEKMYLESGSPVATSENLAGNPGPVSKTTIAEPLFPSVQLR